MARVLPDLRVTEVLLFELLALQGTCSRGMIFLGSTQNPVHAGMHDFRRRTEAKGRTLVAAEPLFCGKKSHKSRHRSSFDAFYSFPTSGPALTSGTLPWATAIFFNVWWLLVSAFPCMHAA